MVDRLYTQRQIRDSLVRMGLSTGWPDPGKADILAAVAMVESATFDNPGYANFDLQGDLDRVGEREVNGKHYGPSVSCYQIRTFQEDTDTNAIRDINRITQSLDAASLVARRIFELQGLDAWATYTSGKYKAYLPEFYPPPADAYRVVSGDTFDRIDSKLGLPRGTMQAYNPNYDPRRLQIGQLLDLPYANRTVAPGDTLTRLMRTVGWDWQGTTEMEAMVNEVARYANIANPNLIYPGQQIRILKP